MPHLTRCVEKFATAVHSCKPLQTLVILAWPAKNEPDSVSERSQNIQQGHYNPWCLLMVYLFFVCVGSAPRTWLFRLLLWYTDQYVTSTKRKDWLLKMETRDSDCGVRCKTSQPFLFGDSNKKIRIGKVRFGASYGPPLSAVVHIEIGDMLTCNACSLECVTTDSYLSWGIWSTLQSQINIGCNEINQQTERWMPRMGPSLLRRALLLL